MSALLPRGGASRANTSRRVAGYRNVVREFRRRPSRSAGRLQRHFMPLARLAALALLLLASQGFAASLRGQAAPAPPPASFDVVSVKLDQDPAAQMGIRPVVGNRFSAVVTVNVLIAVAYGEGPALLESQVAGSPSWAATDRFEINATFDGPITAAPGGPPVRLMSMIRTLLADRFKLRIHRETRQLPVYDLVVADADGRRLGPRLTRAPGTCIRLSGALPANVDFSALCGFKRVTPSMITGKGVNMDALAGALGQRADVQRIVRNRTALEGRIRPGARVRAVQRRRSPAWARHGDGDARSARAGAAT